MATFERLPSGAWRAKVRRAGEKPVTATFDTKNEARTWANEIEVAADRGILSAREKANGLSLSDALDRYQKEITPRKKGARQERGRISRWKRDALSALPLGQLTRAHVTDFIRRRLAAGISPTTVRTDLALISTLFNVAADIWEIPVRNPIRSVDLPAPAPGRTRRLGDEEQDRLFASCRPDPTAKGKAATTTPWLEPAVRLALTTGMRMGELVKLRWEDVDFRNKKATLRDTKNSEDRSVPLPSAAIVTLLALPSLWEDRVIPTTTAALGQAWSHATKRAGIVGLRFHDLRHEAISRFFEQSDLRDLEIQGIVGHLDPRMLKRYTHLRAGDLADRIDGRR